MAVSGISWPLLAGAFAAGLGARVAGNALGLPGWASFLIAVVVWMMLGDYLAWWW